MHFSLKLVSTCSSTKPDNIESEQKTLLLHYKYYFSLILCRDTMDSL